MHGIIVYYTIGACIALILLRPSDGVNSVLPLPEDPEAQMLIFASCVLAWPVVLMAILAYYLAKKNQ